MKTKTCLLPAVSLCGLLVGNAFSADTRDAPKQVTGTEAHAERESVRRPTPDKPHQNTTAAAAKVATAPAPSTVLSDEEKAEAKRRHIRSNQLQISTPPPAPREETKPVAPAANYVWKPGHWAVVKGEWQWTPGEWGVPPTPISVWIEPKYEEKEQLW